MKRELCVFLVICAFVLVTVSPVTSITNHNLQWGFEVGDRFHYRVTGELYTGFSDYYVEINYVPTIPDDVYSYVQISIGQLDYSLFFTNGTEWEGYYNQLWTALPIGNWTLVQELVDSGFIDYEWINTASEWGVIYTQDYGSTVQTTTLKLSKTDGVLNLLRVVTDPEIGLTVASQIERIGGGLSLPVLFIGVGSAVVIVVFVGLIYKERQR